MRAPAFEPIPAASPEAARAVRGQACGPAASGGYTRGGSVRPGRPRRRLAALIAACALGGPLAVQAQDTAYPDHPVRVIVATAAGSGADIVARIVAASVSQGLGQQLLVENRPGAGGNIAAEAAARTAPDGYTMLVMVAGMTINPSLYAKLKYDIVRDFDTVAMLAGAPLVLAVHPSIPAKSVKELIAFAKARPGELNYASSGSGSSPHLSAELFRMQAGIDIVHVPYKGSPRAVTDLIAGAVALMFAAPSSLMPHVEAGRLRGLAVASAEPTQTAPGLPTMSAAGLPGYEASTWSGLLVPAGTPKTVIERVSAEVAKALRTPRIQSQLAARRFDPRPVGAAQFHDFLVKEVAKWGGVVKAVGARVD